MNNTTANATTSEGYDKNCPPPIVGTKTEQWLKISACILILILSVLANTFIIFIVNRKQRIKTVTNCLVANMACSDLLIGLINMPNMIKEEVTSSHALPFGGLGGSLICKLLVISQDVSAFCSILSLIAIAIERYIAIYIPFKKYITLANVKYVIVTCWVIAFVMSSPLLYANKIYLYDGAYECGEDWTPLDQMTAVTTYTLVTFTLLYATPLLTICTLYALVVYHLWHQSIPGDHRTPQSRKNRSKAKKRVLKMLIAIVLAFALCWLPYHTYFFLDVFHPPFKDCGPPLKLYFTSKFFAYANSAVSPCIFIFFDKGVKRYITNKINPCCEGLIKSNAGRINNKRSVLYSSNSDPDPTQTNGVVRLNAYKIYGNDIMVNERGRNKEVQLTSFKTPDLIEGHSNGGFQINDEVSPTKTKRTVSFAH